MTKGVLIVIDGIDGSGKTTQIGLLKKYLDLQGVPCETISFPQYGENKFAKEIEDYLKGNLGSLDKVDPYFIATAFASDRTLAKEEINQWLKEGKIVIANRYVSSSKAHLGANLPQAQREKFFRWLDKLEFETNGIPKEDLTILLSVDPKVGQKNVQEGKVDIHENNLKHLKEAGKIYLKLSQTEPNWYVVNCMEGTKMKSIQGINQEIVELLQRKIV